MARGLIPDYIRKPQYPWNATNQDVKRAFENGVNLAIYNGHGSNSSWTGLNFTDGDCRQLSFNNSAPLILSIACSTANHHIYHNCIAAELSRRTSGGIAVIASSNITILAFSDALLLGMVDAIWPNTYTYYAWSDPIQRKPTYKLFDILNRGLMRVENEQGGGYWDIAYITFHPNVAQYQRECFHVYGDPTVNYNTERPTEYTGITCSAVIDQLSVSIPETQLPAKIVVKNLGTGKIVTHMVTESSTLSEYNFNISKTDSIEVVVSGANKIPYREVVTSHLPLPIPKGQITSVSYDQNTQTAIVSYTLNSEADIPYFIVSDLNNNVYDATIAIGPNTNQRTLDLNNVPNGLCVISMMINNKVVSTYKLLKQ